MKISENIKYVGVNDHLVDLFEGQYEVPGGMSYNSYIITDEKCVVMDTVDQNFTEHWLDNIENILGGKAPDYLVVQHMEPDHSAGIEKFLAKYPNATVVGNSKTFTMIANFFPNLKIENKLEVKNGDVLNIGSHSLTFVFAPMVHWPEVMMTYESSEKALFSADGFGKFGALDIEEDWADEARRYYIGIVGKYGRQVQAVLKKAAALDIQMICPLHGPVLKENLGYYIDLYDKWSSYTPEKEGVVVAYASVYGNTKKAAEILVDELRKSGCPNVVLCDLARCDKAEAVSAAFCYPKLVLAAPTYNGEVYPAMRTFIEDLVERNFQNRTVGLIENGSWAPMAAKVMKSKLENCKNITWLENSCKILSAVKEENIRQLKAMSEELCK